MIRVLLVDDEDYWVEKISPTIAELFGVRIEDLVVAGSRDEACQKILESHFDFAFVDATLPCSDGILEESAGGEVFRSLYRENPRTRLFLVTQHFGTSMRVLNLTNILRQEFPSIDIEPISKTHWTDPKTKSEVEKQIKNQIVVWVRLFLQDLSPRDKRNLLDALERGTTFPAVTHGQRPWRPDEFLFVYPEVLDRQQLRRFLAVDLVYAAAECFGIDGTKQATHPTGYYTGLDGWHSKTIMQLDTFLIALAEGLKLLSGHPKQADVLRSYTNEVEAFRGLTLSVEGKTSPPNDALQIQRNESFRFGTSPHSQTLVVGDAKILRKNMYGTKDFEIFLPVHRIFQDEFRALLKQCQGIRLHSSPTTEVRIGPETWEQGKRPLLFRELFLFEQLGKEDYPEDIPKERLPDCIQTFRSHRFELFGRILLAIRRNGVPKLFDCTHDSSAEVDLDSLGESVRRFLVASVANGATAVFIFEFSGWRQP